MTPQHEVAFNTAFGWHDPNQKAFLFGFGAPTTEHRVSGGAQLPEWPEVSVLGNVKLDDYHGVRNTQLKPVLGFTNAAWHADGLHDMFDGLPELTTMYNPMGWQTSGGGGTYFTSGVRAVERMDPDLVEELTRCSVAYARCPNDEAPDEARRVVPGYSYMVRTGPAAQALPPTKTTRTPVFSISIYALSTPTMVADIVVFVFTQSPASLPFTSPPDDRFTCWISRPALCATMSTRPSTCSRGRYGPVPAPPSVMSICGRRAILSPGSTPWCCIAHPTQHRSTAHGLCTGCAFRHQKRVGSMAGT